MISKSTHISVCIQIWVVYGKYMGDVWFNIKDFNSNIYLRDGVTKLYDRVLFIFNDITIVTLL